MGSFGGMTRLGSSADSAATAKYIVGLIGNMSAMVMYLWSAPTFWTIWRDGTVGETKVFPYMAGVVNCLIWGLYGIPSVQKGHEVMLAVNMFGLLSMLIYSIIYIWFAGEERCFILCYVFVVEGILAGLLVLLLFVLPETPADQTYWVGFSGAITGSIMYIVLVLMDMIVAWRVGNVQHISTLSVVATLVNAVIWLIYACLPKSSTFSLVPNVVGVVVGLLELTFYYSAIYYNNYVGNAQAA